MRCRKARGLLELIADEPAAAAKHSLLSHLQACPACRDYQRRLQALDEAIQADVAPYSGYGPSSQSEERLHRALQAESGKRSRAPVTWVYHALAATPRLRALGHALNTAAALAAAACLALTLLSAPRHRPTECQFGHIASLSVKRLPDGRVVASLTDRGTAGRGCLRQEYRP